MIEKYAARLPAGADSGEHVISLGVMSKSFAMAGLRIGWLASRDHDLLARCAAFKDYTTICAAAPSEILGIIALRARETILARSRALVGANLARFDAFLAAKGALSLLTYWRVSRYGGTPPYRSTASTPAL